MIHLLQSNVSKCPDFDIHNSTICSNGLEDIQTKLILQKQVLLSLSGLNNPHQLALGSQISSPVVNKYVNSPETVDAIDAQVLSSILLNGARFSPEKILDMKLGDIFEFSTEEK